VVDMSSLPNNIRPIFCINPRDHIVRCLNGVKKIPNLL